MKEQRMRITFLGAAGTVTGSKTLLEVNGLRILIDAGLFQGLKELRQLNWKKLPFAPAGIDSVILTHAHLDHCGYLPRLVKEGFRGSIYCTPPTIDLADIVMRDSGKIQEEDARKANEQGFGHHRPALPLYTVKDAMAVLPLMKAHGYGRQADLGHGVHFSFFNTGHILGSAGVRVQYGRRSIVFSGDLGREKPLFLYPKEEVESADYLVCESTYGDRLHSKTSPYRVIKEAIWRAYRKKSVLLIPAFAIERTQEVIYIIHRLRMKNALPPIPVYLDSPMGINATEIMLKYPQWHRLSEAEAKAMVEAVRLIRDPRSSRSLVRKGETAVIMAGSGMIEGGRILDYLERYLSDPDAGILLVGFQAEGTRGRALLEGAAELKFHGRFHRVKAHIRHLDSLSAHADQSELLDWLQGMHSAPERIFLNHGEKHQADALRVKIKSVLGWDVQLPQLGQHFELG